MAAWGHNTSARILPMDSSGLPQNAQSEAIVGNFYNSIFQKALPMQSPILEYILYLLRATPKHTKINILLFFKVEESSFIPSPKLFHSSPRQIGNPDKNMIFLLTKAI